MTSGTLYLVGTPIGNLDDISARALRVLSEVDLILCEDTRHSGRLLAHFGIPTPRESYHEHNEASRTPRLLAMLESGKSLALVSDAGMPLISDPGRTLVSACRGAGIAVVPIPGPVAAVAALAGSGLPVATFLFAGFLDARRSARRKRIGELATVPATLVLYEAPHRIIATLEDLCEVLGPREACLARELTKIHEEWLRGTLPEILENLRGRSSIQGEITLVIAEGTAPARARAACGSIGEEVAREMDASGASLKEALRSVARQRGISRREAYRALLDARESSVQGSPPAAEDTPAANGHNPDDSGRQ
jgi:16S rRNA (cytidine1402-2'-O)-methyltransferase